MRIWQINRLAKFARLAACGTALAGLGASPPPERSFNPRSFGYNLSQSLLNPLEPGSSEAALQREVAGILYDVRMGGGQVVRWIVTDVWPQWRCSKDPEDQQDGTLDPAWPLVSRALLEEAARQGVTVVVSLAYLSNGGFAATAIDSAHVASDAYGMAVHRAEAAGKDGYGDGHAACNGARGYYGHTNQAALFTDDSLREHLKHRYSEMARTLADLPALGAIELFNEPDMGVAAKPEFWATVKELRRVIHGASEPAAQIPVISGVAAWNRAIVGAAKQASALDEEPFITVHAYDDYTSAGKDTAKSLRSLLAHLGSLIPDKPVTIAEIGGGTPIHTLSEFSSMLGTIITVYIQSKSGVWVWGNWFHQPVETDFAMDFNHRSVIGPAFRPYFFADREREYDKPKLVQAIDDASGTTSPLAVTIGQTSHTEPATWTRDRWQITLGEHRLLGFSRAGVFSRPFPDAPGLFTTPPPTLFISPAGEPLSWASIAYSGKDWEVQLFACGSPQTGPQAADIDTPAELLGLAADEGRQDFVGCSRSRLIIRARI